MPNVVLTNACNLNCSFCFATEYRAGSQLAGHMSAQELADIVRFAGQKQIRICGGEPTLHPQFSQLLQGLLQDPCQNGWQHEVFVMTNGLWPKPVRDYLKNLNRSQRKRLTFMFNILPPETYSAQQYENLLACLGSVAENRAALGMTIDKSPIVYKHLIALALQFGFRQLRFSIAAPNITDPGSWMLDPERDFAVLAQQVYDFVLEARSHGLVVQSDCGYIPPCFFSAGQLRVLQKVRDPRLAMEFGCFGPVDIGPGGHAWRCYGLYSTTRVHCNEFEHYGEMAQHFEDNTRALDQVLLFAQCADCEYKAAGTCGGGCYALRALQQLRARALADGVAIDDSPQFWNAVPHLDRARLRFTKVNNQQQAVFLLEGVWEPLLSSDFEAALLQNVDGTSTVAELAQMEFAQHHRERLARTVRRLYQHGALLLRVAKSHNS